MPGPETPKRSFRSSIRGREALNTSTGPTIRARPDNRGSGWACDHQTGNRWIRPGRCGSGVPERRSVEVRWQKSSHGARQMTILDSQGRPFEQKQDQPSAGAELYEQGARAGEYLTQNVQAY